MLDAESLDEMLEGLDCECRSIEALLVSLDKVVASGDIPRMMPLIDLLETQSLLVYRDYLLVSVEEAELGANSERPFF